MFSSSFAKIFVATNLVFFVGFVIYYDAIEMPNRIGYVTLALASVAAAIFYFQSKENSRAVIHYGIAVWFSLGIFAHNINFLIAPEYQGGYVIKSKRPIQSFMESWELRLDNRRDIVLRVSDVSSGDGVNLDLRKGLFGVYFGTWRAEK